LIVGLVITSLRHPIAPPSRRAGARRWSGETTYALTARTRGWTGHISEATKGSDDAAARNGIAARRETAAQDWWLDAIAVGGPAGVTHLLKLIEAEMRVAMALTSRTTIAAIDRSVLADRPSSRIF
jgi:hypothetical protein